MGARLFHAGGRTDMTKLKVAFPNFASAPTKEMNGARNLSSRATKQFNTTNTFTSLPQIVLQNFRSQITHFFISCNHESDVTYPLCYSPLLKDIMLQTLIISDLFNKQDFRPLQRSILVLRR